jgi:hypothetical protein
MELGGGEGDVQISAALTVAATVEDVCDCAAKEPP